MVLSWWERLMPRNDASRLPRARQTTQRRRFHYRPVAENLESRVAPATNLTFGSPILTMLPGKNPDQSVVADFNHDGIPDVAFVDDAAGAIGVMFGKGDGTFGAPTYSNAVGGNQIASITAGDFNKDGFMDVACSYYNTNIITVALNDGTGHFPNQTTIAGASVTQGVWNPMAHSISFGDFNKNGNLGVAWDNRNGYAFGDNLGAAYYSNGAVYSGNGNGTFQAINPTTTSGWNTGALLTTPGTRNYYGSAIAVGDLNGDGFPDVVTAYHFGNFQGYSVFLNNGNTTFTNSALIQPGGFSNPDAVVLGDFNGDGKLDMAVANAGNNTVSILFGNGNGTFGAPTNYNVVGGSLDGLGTARNDIALAPNGFLNTGKPDLVVAGGGSVTILQNQGGGVFAPMNFYSGVNASSVAIGDMNGDGATDIVLTSYGQGIISVLPNEAGNKLALSSSLNPASAGQAITFTATVTPSVAGSPAPTGTITFFDNGSPLGTASVSNGMATFSTSTLAIGTHSITASYSGDKNFFTSVAAAVSESVGLAPTTTTVTSSASTVGLTQPVTFTATVSSAFTGAAITGTVTFFDNGNPIGTVAVSGGKASFAVTLSGGTHSITASYGGSGTFLPSSSSASGSSARVMVGVHLYATGADAGALGVVNVYDGLTGALKFSLLPFGAFFTGGVTVAVGDVNGDGVDDIICGAGPGGAPVVEVFDGVTGNGIMSIMGLPAGFRGGVFVAAGDVNGDGKADIIVGAGPGAGPQVNVFNGADGTLLKSFFAFPASFRGGVRVAAGDVNGDGLADIICGAGPGGAPQVTAFDFGTLNQLASFYAFTPFFAGGVYVGAGDMFGEGFSDILVGAGAGGGPQVTIFHGKDFAIRFNGYAPGYPSTFTGGIRVGGAYLNGSSTAALLTSAGPGGGPQVTGIDPSTLNLLTSFFAYNPMFTGGVWIS
jgi:hypothetical protein